MSSNNKMKGLFRNIRLMFDSEKEPEIQIGYPTDVKHVAHIGWDGPSVNSPSWMNEFKSPNGFASAPIAPPGEVGQNNEPIQWSSEDKGRANRNRDLPEVPKATRRNMSAGAGADSPSREKPRTRRSSKSSKDDPDRPRRHKEAPQDSQDSTSQDLPDIPKTRRKKSKDSSASKDSSVGRSSRSKTKSHDTASSECGSVKSLGSERRRNSARDSLEELEEAIS